MSPFKSRSQVRKFRAMLGRGEISQAKFDEWAHETPNIKRLPERVKKKKTAGKKKIINKSKKSKKQVR